MADTNDPRIPGEYPDAFLAEFKEAGGAAKAAWREGYALALVHMDAGLFDHPTREEINAAAEYAFTVESYWNGHEFVKGAWVIVDQNGEIVGPLFGTRREAEREAVARWRDEIRFA